MSVRSGQSVTVEFTTRVWATGVGTNADSTPTGILYVNGTADAASVTVTNISTGLYKAQVTLPTLAVGDEVQIVIAATVSSVSDKAVIWGDTKDVFAGAIPDVIAGGAGGLFIAGTNAATTVTTSFTTTFTGNLTGSVASVTGQLTAAQIATGVWQDTTAGDFTTALSVGKSIMNGVSLGTGLTVARCTLADTLTTYTGNTVQTGDSFARIGAAGVGLTAVALTGTQAFSNTGTWTGNIVGTLSTLTTYTGNTLQTGDSFARIGATGSGLTTLAPSATALSTVQWTAARAGYLDNINVGGAVASQADVQAVNQSASKHILIQTVGQYERPESGTVTYTVELRTFSASTGAAVNADSTPTIAPVGSVSGDLSANLGAVSNPATGVYRATYSVTSAATLEQIRFDGAATIAAAAFTLSCYSQVVDLVSVTWNSTNASNLTAIFNKLPTNAIADETLVLAAIAGVQTDTDDIQARLPAALVGGLMSSTSVVTGDLSATMKTSVTTAATAATPIAASVTGNVGGIAGTTQTLDALQTALNSAHGAGSWATATGFSTLDAAGVRTAVGLTSANLDTQIAAVKADTAAVKVKTDFLPSATAGAASGVAIVGSAMTLSAAYDFAKGTVAVTESYNADGAAPTPVQALMMMLQRLTEFSISGTTITVKKLDGSTTAATLTMDSATAPTSSTRAS